MNLHLEHTIVRAFFYYLSVTLIAIVIVTQKLVTENKSYMLKVAFSFLSKCLATESRK